MKILKILFCITMFGIFSSDVYAFTYEIDANFNNKEVVIGSNEKIEISLTNVQGSDLGIMACSLNILFDGDILLDSRISTLNSWTMTSGKQYYFDTGTGIVSNQKMFIIPVKVNGPGSVKITDIQCSDYFGMESTGDEIINFTIKNVDNTTSDDNNNNKDNSSNNSNIVENENNNQTDNVEVNTNSCDLINIQLSEGSISNFDSAVTEYSIKVSDFENLKVVPTLETSDSSCIVEKNIDGDNKTVVITVSCGNDNTKVYTLYAEEINVSEDNKGNNNIWTPIFIGIICILVLVNIFRIIKNRKKN